MNFANYARINALKYPDKVCLIERFPAKKQRRSLTWRDFNDEINRAAHFLQKRLNINRGDHVLHLLNNSLEWLITYFGIIKLGAVVVPLNFRFAGKDILYAAGIARPAAFILGTDFLDRVIPVQEQLEMVKSYVILGDECPPNMIPGMIPYSEVEAFDENDEAIIEMQDDDDLALMFTSGTTGDAKPVIHTHGSLNATAIGNGLSFPMDVNDNYIFFLPLFHAGAMFYWTAYYACGATGTLIRDCRNPLWILEAISEECGTGVFPTVPFCVDLINQIKSGDIDLKNYDLSSWRDLITGAQPVPYDVLKSLVDLLPCRIHNAYGVTEAGGGATWALHHDDILTRPGSIGKPNFGVEGKIVDEKGDEVSTGQVGELIIKSPRLMKGYYKNRNLTEQSIKGGLFYTGDLTRLDEEGYYYIVDRKKDTITCGGENIYPLEIEDVLHEHRNIDDAAVIGYPDDRLVEIVMAVVQVKAGMSLSEEEVIEFCKSKLALYKVPRKVVFGDVPRNPTGKLMKPLLREKYTGRREAFKI
ncbi:MAG: acyl--CoA ligase [Deltaproteobacteria bacterium]|nr:acyl--CoA ligase [Deltaproteobacteria bacterium]